MFDTSKETPISLSDATHLASMPRRRAGKRPHKSTLYRWGSHGFRGVRLDVLRIGSTLCTSREALQRFFERTTEADPHLGRSPRSTEPINDEEQREIERRLDDIGVVE